MTMVVSAKNGSIVAVTGSGIRHMSDSLIAFQPAIEEPSNIWPSAKVSSSIMLTSKVTCCHLPRGSVKRRSTYLTSLSLIAFRTSLAVFMHTPLWLCGSVSRLQATLFSLRGGARVHKQNRAAEAALFPRSSVAKFGIAPGSDSVQPGFAGSDADRFLDVGDEDLAVADASRLRRAADRIDRALDQVVADHDLDFHLGQEVHDVFCAAVELGMTLLAPKTLGLSDGDALKSDFLKRLFHLVELERLDDGFDFLH